MPRKIEKYRCPECQGRGEVECDCCGSDINCCHCDGTGLNPELIDIGAWIDAKNAHHRQPGTPGRGTFDLIENGCTTGRTDGVTSVRFEQFCFKPVS